MVQRGDDMVLISELSKSTLNMLSRPIIQGITDFYKKPENQQKFEEWHFKKYGCYPKTASYKEE